MTNNSKSSGSTTTPKALRMQHRSRADAVEYGAAYTGDDCLIWPFYRGAKGYGHTRHNGTRMLASRAVALEKHGPPPNPAMEAAHSCHNTGCFNGRHLSWQTQAQNMADRPAARGEGAGKAKLTEVQVREMRALYPATSSRELAARFGVTASVAWKAATGRTWSHVA